MPASRAGETARGLSGGGWDRVQGGAGEQEHPSGAVGSGGRIDQLGTDRHTGVDVAGPVGLAVGVLASHEIEEWTRPTRIMCERHGEGGSGELKVEVHRTAPCS